MLSKANENIINYIKMQFHEDISNFISTLSKQQILDIQDRLFDYTSIEELKKSLKNLKNIRKKQSLKGGLRLCKMGGEATNVA